MVLRVNPRGNGGASVGAMVWWTKAVALLAQAHTKACDPASPSPCRVVNTDHARVHVHAM